MKRNKEIWKTTPEYPRYKISNFGNIVSKPHTVVTSSEVERRYSQKTVVPRINKNSGLYQVGLRDKDGKIATVYVHKLVAQVFVENKTPRKRKWVSHKDGNLTNNTAENLIWVTRAEAVKNRYLHSPEKIRKKQGRRDPLNEDKILRALKIREETGKSWQKIALEIGCSASHLWKKVKSSDQ